MFIQSKKLITYFILSNIIFLSFNVQAENTCDNYRDSLYYEKLYTEAFNKQDYDTIERLKNERKSMQDRACEPEPQPEPDSSNIPVISSTPGTASTDSTTPEPSASASATANSSNTAVPSIHDAPSVNENTGSVNTASEAGNTDSLMLMEPPPWLTSESATGTADSPTISPASEPAVSTPSASAHGEISEYVKKPTSYEHLHQVREINSKITPLAEQQATLIDARNKLAIFEYQVTSKQLGSGNKYLIQMVTKKPIADMKTAISFVVAEVIGVIPYINKLSDPIMYVFDEVFEDKSTNKSKWMQPEEWEKYREKLESAKKKMKQSITKKLCDNWEKEILPQLDLLYEQEKQIEANNTLNMHSKRALLEEITRRSNRVFHGIGRWSDYKQLKKNKITTCPYNY